MARKKTPIQGLKISNRLLFKMSLGTYYVTDGIYNYQIGIGLTGDGTRFYNIELKGSLPFSSHIFMLEYKDILYKKFEYKKLSALSGVGGLNLHTDDVYNVLNALTYIPRGSFKNLIK